MDFKDLSFQSASLGQSESLKRPFWVGFLIRLVRLRLTRSPHAELRQNEYGYGNMCSGMVD